jgi:hypothetical protein
MIHEVPVAVAERGVRRLACWDCGFESRQQYGNLSLMGVVCCPVEVSATGRSFVQRSPTECSVSLFDVETSTVERPWTDKSSCEKVPKKKMEHPGCRDFDAMLYTLAIRYGYDICSRLIPLCPILYLCFQGLTFFVRDIASFTRAPRFHSKACVFV